ncbi:MAG: DUF4013 domain-containing protein [Muribaculaceae bacterium]|nr:DUF4013 domain-containing protein [Muribaculaceae bacterium]
MKNVLNTLKGLYKGENIVKRHILFSTLLILPAITVSVKEVIDKDMPENLKILILTIAAGFALASIIPWIFSQGLRLRFINERFDDPQNPLPILNLGMFTDGLKIIPLQLIWCFYYLLLLAVGIGIALLPLISIGFNPSAGIPFILGIIFAAVIIPLVMILLTILYPFMSMVIIKYAKNVKYNIDLFNPLLVVEYIKKSFKPIIITALKYTAAGIVAGFGCGIIQIILVLLLMLIGIFFVISSPETAHPEYTPQILVLSAIITSIATLIQYYISGIIGFGYTATLVEVYKEENLDEIKISEDKGL